MEKAIQKRSETALVGDDWREQMELVKSKIGRGLDDTEFKLAIHMAKKYNLDPLVGEIYAVKYGNSPAQIFVSRNGLLAIAHQTGQFDGMETEYDEKSKVATCKVYRKDMSHAVIVTVDFDEYNTGKSTWASKPKTMIKKVAEAAALRRAFSIHGVYIEEEREIENVNKQPRLETTHKPLVPDGIFKKKKKKEKDTEPIPDGAEEYLNDRAVELKKRLDIYETSKKPDDPSADAIIEEVSPKALKKRDLKLLDVVGMRKVEHRIDAILAPPEKEEGGGDEIFD